MCLWFESPRPTPQNCLSQARHFATEPRNGPRADRRTGGGDRGCQSRESRGSTQTLAFGERQGEVGGSHIVQLSPLSSLL